MPLVVAGLLGMWFVAPLVAFYDPAVAWATFGSFALMMIVGAVAELWP